MRSLEQRSQSTQQGLSTLHTSPHSDQGRVYRGSWLRVGGPPCTRVWGHIMESRQRNSSQTPGFRVVVASGWWVRVTIDISHRYKNYICSSTLPKIRLLPETRHSISKQGSSGPAPAQWYVQKCSAHSITWLLTSHPAGIQPPFTVQTDRVNCQHKFRRKYSFFLDSHIPSFWIFHIALPPASEGGTTPI